MNDRDPLSEIQNQKKVFAEICYLRLVHFAVAGFQNQVSF